MLNNDDTMKKIILKIKGMHCTSCAMLIDLDLEETEGVIESKTSYAKHQTEVKFNEDRITEEEIIKTIKNSGYKSDVQKEK